MGDIIISLWETWRADSVPTHLESWLSAYRPGGLTWWLHTWRVDSMPTDLESWLSAYRPWELTQCLHTWRADSNPTYLDSWLNAYIPGELTQCLYTWRADSMPTDLEGWLGQNTQGVQHSGSSSILISANTATELLPSLLISPEYFLFPLNQELQVPKHQGEGEEQGEKNPGE